MDIQENEKESKILFRDIYFREDYSLKINEDEIKNLLEKFVNSRFL